MGLIVHSVAVEMIREIRPLVERVARHDRSLSKQMRDSASSVALNIGEGARRRGGSARQHFEIAAGSASETRSALQVAAAWGYVAETALVAADAKLDRIGAMLWGLTSKS